MRLRILNYAPRSSAAPRLPVCISNAVPTLQSPCLFVEALTTIDCGILDARHGLRGDSLVVDVELGGALNEQAMVMDFRDVKQRLKRCIDAAVDHRLVIPRELAGVELHQHGQRVELAFACEHGALEYLAPAVAVAVIDSRRVTPAALAAHLQPLVAAAVPDSVEHIRLHLRHARSNGARYHYTHGLRRHGGHCKRLGHGHHSRVLIKVDGQRDAALEQRWAQNWDGVHLGTREDLLAQHNGQLRFGYDSSEGRYELAVPESRCYLIDGATTVERLARHIASGCAQARPGCEIEVRAWEGCGKGGLANVTG